MSGRVYVQYDDYLAADDTEPEDWNSDPVPVYERPERGETWTTDPRRDPADLVRIDADWAANHPQYDYPKDDGGDDVQEDNGVESVVEAIDTETED